MRKVIAAINMTLDGFSDHTSGIVDDELHQHYNDLLKDAGVMLYGRKTFQLMESYWPDIVKNPTGNKPEDEFAVLIHNVPKIVFSRTLASVEWENSRLSKKSPEEEITELRQKPGKDIFLGSPGLIAAMTNLNLIDEYQICVHPVIAGSGLPLFKNINNTIILKLIKTLTIKSSACFLYYHPVK